jgi:hypothetical protein
MIHDFAGFFPRLKEFLRIKDGFSDDAFRLTRPAESEDESRPRRRGLPGDFRLKLGPRAIRELQRVCAPVLQELQYEEWDDR